MKLYIAAGRYVGTQAEAKKLDKDFEAVEVPTDKEGLIGHLNGLLAISDAIPQDQRVTVSHHEFGEDWFEAQPLAYQLTLAALACENARGAIKPLVIEDEVDPFA